MQQVAEDTGMTAISSGRSGAAERMRRHRKRRRDGLRCLTIELRETEVDVLIRKGMLKADARNDRSAVLCYGHYAYDFCQRASR
jgi:hypothetical protein